MKKTLLFTLLAGLAFPLSSEAAEKMTVMLDWFVNPDHGPIILAKEKGYFSAEGLDVDIQAPADPSDPPKLAAAGKVDLAIAYQPQLHMQVAEGLPLKRVGTLVSSPLNCLLTLKDGPVKTLADLKGRKVGFSVGGIEEALITAMLKTAGLSLSDVEMVNVNFSLSPSLMAGQVDAVIGAYRNFELNQMAIEGKAGHCFEVEANGIPAYDELIYVANPQSMNKDRILRFLRATEKAEADIAADPEGTWKIFSATSKELQDELNARAWKDTIAHFAPHPAALDGKRYTDFSAFMANAKLIPAQQKLEDLALDLTKDK